MQVFHTDCKEWQGYKPCNKQKEGLVRGCDSCLFYNPVQQNILLIEAGGLGSALRVSVVAKELKMQYPNALIQWLTNDKSAELISTNVSSIDRVYSTTWENMMILGSQAYFLVINFESDPIYLAFVSGLLLRTKGFVINECGNLDIASSSAREFLRLQTDDSFRRRENVKSMQQILLEVAGLKWSEQSYNIITRPDDNKWAKEFLVSNGVDDSEALIGLNIGSSLRHSAKRWPPGYFYELAKVCADCHPKWKFLVVAGPEDVDAYNIVAGLNEISPTGNLIFTGCDNTMSQFISLVDNLSVVISADTFGLHVAIGLGKKTISLWGPQPENETYSYGTDVKMSIELECAPCFAGTADKCVNPNQLWCMRGISVEKVFQTLENILICAA